MNISILSLKEDIDWDYKNHGTDWATNFEKCGKGQQAPGLLSTSGMTILDDTRFFYSSFNVREGQTKQGKMELIEHDNILSIKFDNLGTVLYNMEDPFGDGGVGGSYDEIEIQEAKCHNILIKVPGEHSLDGIAYDGELQVNCTFKPPQSSIPRGVFIAIPIKIDDNNESKFSQNIKNMDKDKKEINFNAIDITDAYSMMDGVYYYEAQSNYPPCDIFSIWFYVNKPVNFSNDVIEIIKGLMDEDRCPDGNNRSPQRFTNTLYIYPQ